MCSTISKFQNIVFNFQMSSFHISFSFNSPTQKLKGIETIGKQWSVFMFLNIVYVLYTYRLYIFYKLYICSNVTIFRVLTYRAAGIWELLIGSHSQPISTVHTLSKHFAILRNPSQPYFVRKRSDHVALCKRAKEIYLRRPSRVQRLRTVAKGCERMNSC